MLLSRFWPQWRSALAIVHPDTVLQWHRVGFRLYWRRISKNRGGRPRVDQEYRDLIARIARENPGWEAERIRGELLKLGIRVCKPTIQKYVYQVRGPRSGGQSWATFLKHHAHQTWSCDFLQTHDALFRSVFVFFIIAIDSRRVVHVGVTRYPTQAWVAQQLRNATPYDVAPRFLIRDNDSKFGTMFDKVADGAGINVLKTPYHAPKANAFCERFLGSVRRECLDHMLILSLAQFHSVLREYVEYFNTERPHHGLAQRVPSMAEGATVPGSRIAASPILGGLHHEYRWAA